jgi:hypothetical protein
MSSLFSKKRSFGIEHTQPRFPFIWEKHQIAKLFHEANGDNCLARAKQE